MPSIALTDNGSMFGAISFYLMAKKKGISPIIGCEVFLTPDMAAKDRPRDRLILLAKNHHGYKSLVHIVTLAHLEGFYYKPRIDLNHLAELAHDLIAISPGGRGPVADRLKSHQTDDARTMAASLKAVFGDQFYLGLTRHGVPYEDLATDGSCAIGKELDIPVVATQDVYYLTQNLAHTRQILTCIQTGRKRSEDTRGQFESNEAYLKSPQEMIDLFADLPEAIANTVRIADQCKLTIQTEQVNLPRFECPDGLTPSAYLESLVWSGIAVKYGEATPEIKDRVAFELSIIDKMNYPIYFLVIFDFLDYARKAGIPIGPGRGSAAGSIVAYALDITNVDPLKYHLLFERFLNPDRVSMPDIDLDFCIRRRGEVIAYIIEKYGKAHVSQIVTFGTMASRAVVRDVGRVLGIPLSEIDRIAKLIPSHPGHTMSIAEAIDTVPELKPLMAEREDIRELMTIAGQLEGLARHTSTHAAGVVISRDPIEDTVPLIRNEGQIVTQYSMIDLEKVGMLKMDILGLRNLTVIKDTLELIQARHGVTLDLHRLAVDDPDTYAMLSEGHTTGVFQLESRGMRALIKDMKPQVFEDLIALLALYRPGPLGSGMVSDFISNKSGLTKVKYPIPEVEAILKPTYGMIVYQEQVMQIASAVGGFSLGQADMLRRAMGKKNKAEMDQLRDTFLDGAKALSIDIGKAGYIFDLCYKFAEYGFNKSHSAAYALISYQTAFLKVHYPAEYVASLISSVLGSADKVSLYATEAKRLGHPVLPPDINESGKNFTVTPTGLRFGLMAIKNVGETAIDTIITARDKVNGKFNSFRHFCDQLDYRIVNKRVVESLIKVGCFDLMDDRNRLLEIHEWVLDAAQSQAKERLSGQLNLFGEAGGSQEISGTQINADFLPFSKNDLLRMEKELLGVYVSGHPLDGVHAQLAKFPFTTQTLGTLEDGATISLGGILTEARKIITKTNREMLLGILEDLEGTATVMVFQGEGFERAMKVFQNDAVVSIRGKVRVKDDETTIIAEEILLLDGGHAQKQLHIDLENIATTEVISQIQSIMVKHRGATPVLVHMGDQQLVTGKRFWVNQTSDCISRIENAVGSGRVWVGTQMEG